MYHTAPPIDGLQPLCSAVWCCDAVFCVVFRGIYCAVIRSTSFWKGSSTDSFWVWCAVLCCSLSCVMLCYVWDYCWIMGILYYWSSRILEIMGILYLSRWCASLWKDIYSYAVHRVCDVAGYFVWNDGPLHLIISEVYSVKSWVTLNL